MCEYMFECVCERIINVVARDRKSRGEGVARLQAAVEVDVEALPAVLHLRVG